MFQPTITDKAGRGALCSVIDQLTKAIGRESDAHEQKRLLKRLDSERTKFHRLYSYTPKPQEDAHAESV